MSKHTPGPWTTPPSDGGFMKRATENGNMIPVHSRTGRIASVWHGNEANARLIAAAPDLLAALEEAERVIRWAAQESAGRVDKEKVGGWLHHADQARAAIAKARGADHA